MSVNNVNKAKERKFILEFIELYQTLQALWNVRCKEYSNRNEKHEQYKLLLAKYREQYPNADKQQLVKKINSLRTNYRRELKRVNDAQKNGEVYETTLWYFEGMQFLGTSEDEKTFFSQSTSGSIPNIEKEVDEENSIEIDKNKTINEATTAIQHSNKKSKTIAKQISERNKLLKEALEQLKNDTLNNPKDDATIYADSWAVSYRNITGIQKLYAKKAIEDILFLGMVGQLTPNCVQSSYFSNTPTTLGQNYQETTENIPFICEPQDQVKIEKNDDFISET